MAALSPVTAPAVLIEVGYISNSEDLIRLSFPAFQEQLAASITSGIVEFLEGGGLSVSAVQ